MLNAWKWLAAALLLALPISAVADPGEDAASPWVHNAQGELRLVSAVTGVGQGERVQVGLQFHNQPGWKIYWRSPGDAGLPPSIDWSGSQNVADAAIAWPAPHRFSYAGLETMGYENEIVLPISVRLSQPGRAADLLAKVDYLICSEVCVPRHADLALSIGIGPASASTNAHLIGRFLARVPGPGAMQGMTLAFGRRTLRPTRLKWWSMPIHRSPAPTFSSSAPTACNSARRMSGSKQRGGTRFSHSMPSPAQVRARCPRRQ